MTLTEARAASQPPAAAGLDLRGHFSRFLGSAPGRIHLAAHSHHYWPDVTREAQIRCWDDAARLADHKWGPVFEEVIPAVQAGIARRLSLPDPATIAVGPNTHDFVVRLLSCFPADRPVRILTTGSEFHSFARQVERLEEEGLVAVERVPAEPFGTFTERMAGAAAGGGHDLVFASEVFFDSGAIGADAAALAEAIPDPATFLVIDGYHAFMARPTDLSAVADRTFYLGGGYKYAMAGEGACFMHCPPGYAPRPRDTGWFAAFGALTGERSGVPYAVDGARFLGATFDPSGLYRQRAVFEWLDREGIGVRRIHDHVLGLEDRFLAGVREAAVRPLLSARLVTPVGPGIDRGHFLAFETPEAGRLCERLSAAGIVTDVRGDRLRFGFACYHTHEDIDGAVAAIAQALAAGPDA